MASTQVIRVTMFKVPKKEDQEAMIKYYAEMFKVAVKVSYEIALPSTHSSSLVLKFPSPAIK